MRAFGVDIDNVVADTDAKIRELIRLAYGINSTRAQITFWNYHDSLPITAEQEKQVFERFHQEYCDTLDVIQGANEVLGRLVSIAPVWLVTHRPEYTRAVTEAWLARHRIPYDQLLFTANKVEYASRLCLLIEDNLETSMAVAANGTVVFLMDQPWNYSNRHHRRIIRVRSWQEIWHVIEIRRPHTSISIPSIRS